MSKNKAPNEALAPVHDAGVAARVIHKTAANQMELGIKAFNAAYDHAQRTKLLALKAGFYFRTAKNLCKHGEFLGLVEVYQKQISVRQVQKCIEFLELAEEWVQSSSKRKLKPEELAELVEEAVLKSPKPFTALLREWKIVEEEGAWDGEKRRAAELRDTQLHFDFGALTKVFSSVNSERARAALAQTDVRTRQELRAALKETLDYLEELDGGVADEVAEAING